MSNKGFAGAVTPRRKAIIIISSSVNSRVRAAGARGSAIHQVRIPIIIGCGGAPVIYIRDG
jgi:hypothetical protein